MIQNLCHNITYDLSDRVKKAWPHTVYVSLVDGGVTCIPVTHTKGGLTVIENFIPHYITFKSTIYMSYTRAIITCLSYRLFVSNQILLRSKCTGAGCRCYKHEGLQHKQYTLDTKPYAVCNSNR